MKKIVLLVVAAFLFQYFYKAESQQVSVATHENVILYATSWCGYCKKTRAFLAENDIKYIEYDIEKTARGRDGHKALGGRGVPVLDVKGNVIYGYSVAKMKSTFKALGLM